MAHRDTWEKLRYFKATDTSDVWGDPKLIDDTLLWRLDDFRHYLGVPIHVLHGVKSGGHSSKSYHYVANGACAVDIIIPKYQYSAIDLILDATRFGFTGIGYYPDWKYRGDVVGGLHLDTRPLVTESDRTLNYKHARWLGVQTLGGGQKYIAMTFNNLFKYALSSDDVVLGMH